MRLADWIISNFPKKYEDYHYVEPFSGALSVFFKKNPSKMEVINDINSNIFWVYKILRDQPDKLSDLLKNTMYCEKTLKEAVEIYKNSHKHSILKRAWATYIYFDLSFGGKGEHFGYSLNHLRKENISFHNRKKNIPFFNMRLKNAFIFNRDAFFFIEKNHQNNKFLFYLDPPYPETTQNQYFENFKMDRFNNMLDLLYNAKFKWLLSFYEKEGMNLEKFKKGNFIFLHKEQNSGMAKNKKNNLKIECLLKNYED